MKGRIVETSLESNLSPPAALTVLAVASLGIAALLLAIRHVTLRDSSAARDWIATPCQIEKCELSGGSDVDSLTLEYRYQFNGREYRGDRPDLMPGSSGSDGRWQQGIVERYPAGSRGVCYVNPANPAESVFDRDRAWQNARPLLLLAYPFVCIGLGFSLPVLRFFASDPKSAALPSAVAAASVAGKSKRKRKRNRSSNSAPDSAAVGATRDSVVPALAPPAPPRKLGWLNSAVILAGPRRVQVAWLFVVGFNYIFVAYLDGPAAFAELFDWRRAQAQTIGRVTYVQPLAQRELEQTVYEYEFSYQVGGQSFTATSYTRGPEFSKGESVPVLYDPAQPSAAVIQGARRRNLVWWYSAIPLAVLVLLALGLAGMYWHNFRTLLVLRAGEVARATRCQTVAVGSNDAAAFATASTLLSPYQFRVSGAAYSARHYGPEPGQENATEVVVLYHPASPNRNVILDEHLRGLIGAGRGQSVFSRALDCLSAPLAIVAIALLAYI